MPEFEASGMTAQAAASPRIAVVERNAFLRDCLVRSLGQHWPGAVVGFETVGALDGDPRCAAPLVALLSILSLTEEEADAELAALTAFEPPPRSMVLSRKDDLNEALTALGQGANGYISMSAGFEVFVEALRFVGAGGAYVPAQCLLAAGQSASAPHEQASLHGITSRELAVIRAIRQGKPNKVIAYELNMCESTVKVHVRHIMKKLQARNRTDVAIKGAELAQAAAARAPVAALASRTLAQ